MPISQQHLSGLKHQLLHIARTEPTVFAEIINDVFSNIELPNPQVSPDSEAMIQEVMDKYAPLLKTLAKGPKG